ncbi:MAG: acyl-CoA dehydrogenase family protein [Bacteroidetes bacterium]|nr:acyl-CoA dehydrogenase family protein [Bacteroidota bacterium]
MAAKSLATLKGVSARDRKMIEDIEVMLGPEPSEMGFVKNLFWGRHIDEMVFPYPEQSELEQAKCDALLQRLERYLKNDHPAVQIDAEERIPQWCIDRFFHLGVMGMTIPEQYGGLGLSVSSYNRVLEMIGSYCASSAVMISAHQSIGCKALMLFGSDEQKSKFLPKVAREYLSAFCLSEPQVGSDAAGQETRCELTPEGDYILNGEKKWSTSGAMAGFFTVMAKQRVTDSKTGKEKDIVTALIVTPDMEGVDVFEKNRSKTGIRGTWQARIRFTNVRVPRENLLSKEGQGLKIALTCLNYGRCTLSAGVTGAAKRARDQATKWVQTRYQFGRPLADFELVQQRLARMAAYCYAMDSVLYMVTGMLDRNYKDVMVETAINKYFCSEFGWRVIDDAMQVMGGEGYMTENEFERLWRDNRIHRIVEGSNEVMQSFIFAYGGKALAEQMIGIQEALGWDNEDSVSGNLNRLLENGSNIELLRRAVPLAAELFLGIRPAMPEVVAVHPSLQAYGDRIGRLVQSLSHYFKMASKWNREDIVQRQAVQARLADNATMIFALTCSLSRLDSQLRSGERGLAFERDRTAFDHLMDLFELQCQSNDRELRRNADESMRIAAAAARRHNDTLPNHDYVIHESSPIAKGTGRPVATAYVRQFPGDRYVEAGGDGHSEMTSLPD